MRDMDRVGAVSFASHFHIFMTSRDVDFEMAIWDCRFPGSMKSLLSPVDIASKERILELDAGPYGRGC